MTSRGSYRRIYYSSLDGSRFVERDIGEEREHTGGFMYLSIPYFAVREYWLSWRSKRWLSLRATVESTHRSRGGYKETIRGELWYSYTLNGEQHSGRVVRDCGFHPEQSMLLRRGTSAGKISLCG